MSHMLAIVTNADKVDLDEQMAPFWEEGEDYFELVVEIENSEQAVNGWIQKQEKGIESQGDLANEKWVQRWKARVERVKNAPDLQSKLKAIAEIEDYEIDKNGNLCWEYNPNAKYDWYMVGGRFSDWLVDSNGQSGNQFKVKDIDWQAVREREVKQAGDRYDAEMSRASVDDRLPYFEENGRIPTKDEYVAEFDCEPVPYALLHDGKFTEWESEFETQEEWGRWFKQMLGALDPETELTVVDYHI